MQTSDYTNLLHTGRKIERVRRLRGMTQTDLGKILGVSKQAVSKLEQTEKIDNDRLEEVAKALGVTSEGLKKFNEETILYNTINFYENCGVKTSAVSNNHTFNNFPFEEAIAFFEKTLAEQRKNFEKALKELNSSGGE